MSFKALQGSMSIVSAAIVVGAGTLVLAVFGLSTLKETFGVDLDFHE